MKKSIVLLSLILLLLSNFAYSQTEESLQKISLQGIQLKIGDKFIPLAVSKLESKDGKLAQLNAETSNSYFNINPSGNSQPIKITYSPVDDIIYIYSSGSTPAVLNQGLTKANSQKVLISNRLATEKVKATLPPPKTH